MLQLQCDAICLAKQDVSHITCQTKTHVSEKCDQLVSLGEGEQQLPFSLEVLELLHCGSVTSLSNDLDVLEFLRELVTKDCNQVC